MSGAVTVTLPGVYDMPNDVYQADPVPGGSLSSTGARRLLDCPAKYRYEADHGRAPKAEYDQGHAAHKLILGVGDELVVVDAGDWRTKAAKQQRDEAYAAGRVPLLHDDYQRAEAMANALRADEHAGPIFEPGNGRPEVSLFWQHHAGGAPLWRRARIDWLIERQTGRTLVVDHKTAASAAPDHIERAINSYGYHMQGDWYLTAARELGVADEDAAFVLVVQEKTPPYVVTVVQMTAASLRVGARQNADAIALYRECTTTGVWPGYVRGIAYLGLPPYIENRLREESW